MPSQLEKSTVCASAPSTSPVVSQSRTASINNAFKAGILNADWAGLAGSGKSRSTFNASLLQNNVQQEEPEGLSRTISFWLSTARSTTHLKVMWPGQM
jgi:hypothetical protein